ncbi:MAG: Gmad2 immunoglobulin-like domain-containing protein [Marmoricola sp.]
MTDDDIRRLLHHAVEDVQPRRGRAEVLSRLTEEESEAGARRRWGPGLAVAAAVIVVAGGLGWLQHHTPPPQPASVAAGHDLSLAVYCVGDTAVGPRLFSEQRVLHGVTSSDAQAAVDQVLHAPDDPDYRSGFPAGTTATVAVDGNWVSVDFGSDVRSAAPGTASGTGVAAAQALVWTLDGVLQRPVSVRLTEHGQPIHTLLGDPVDLPVRQGSADDVLSPVSVTLPQDAQLTSGTTIRGQAAAFEGGVVWDLRQNGRSVEHGYTTAGQCCTLSPYAFVLQAPPGTYELRVSDTDPSGGEGNGVTTDTKDITIR